MNEYKWSTDFEFNVFSMKGSADICKPSYL